MYFEEWDEPQISGIRWVSELDRAWPAGRTVFRSWPRSRSGANRIIADPLEVPRRAPDIILGSWCGKKFQPARGGARGRVGRTMPAVRDGFVREIKSALILQPGPAALTDGVRAIQAVIEEWAARRLARLRHDAAALADQLVGFDDLLGALLGVLDHRLGQAVGLELVGMMAAQLAPIGFDDLVIARRRQWFPAPVGLLELLPPPSLRCWLRWRERLPLRMRSTASICASSSIETPSRLATRLRSSRTGPSMLLPASAARTWISRNDAQQLGAALDRPARRPPSSAARSKPAACRQ